MSATHLTAACLLALLAAGCSHLPSEASRTSVPWWADAPARIVTEASDQQALSPAVRSRRPANRLVASRRLSETTEPLSALSETARWRATWKTEETDFRTLRPKAPVGLPDPSTTAALRDGTIQPADPAQDAQASLGRLIDAGRKAAAPICRGC